MSAYRNENENLKRRVADLEAEIEDGAEDLELLRSENQRLGARVVGEDGLTTGQADVKRRQDRLARIFGAVSAAIGLALVLAGLAMELDGGLRFRSLGCFYVVGPILVMWGVWRFVKGRAE